MSATGGIFRFGCDLLALRAARARLASPNGKTPKLRRISLELSHVPAISAVLADRDGARDGNNLRFLAEEDNEQLPYSEDDPGNDFPPPADKEPIKPAFSPFLFDFGYRLDDDVFTSAFWALHILSPVLS